MQNTQPTQPASYLEATGNIQFNMTNDYMFRYILQKNEKVLRGLICALLHLLPEQILKLEITNPINLSESIVGKSFILDIEVTLNDNTQINLEMQVQNRHNWCDRSLSYLCRSFDHLFRGQEYEEARPVTHIGFLDYTLFPEEPEFYATNMMMNLKTHRIFNDKFKLSVVDLSSIDLATEEDKAYQLDYWARLFKAKTWEEIRMLAEKNEYLQEAAQSVYMANADEIIRQQCLAREEAERYERTLKRDIKKAQEENKKLQNENKNLQNQNKAKDAKIEELEKDKSSQDAELADLKKRLAKYEPETLDDKAKSLKTT